MQGKFILLCVGLIITPVIFGGHSFATNILNGPIIDEYSWAVMMYNHPLEYKNFGNSDVPKPDQGTILIPTDMMSLDLCRIAVEVYREDKLETLQNLDRYIVDHMIHDNPAFIPMRDEWNPPAVNTWRKTNADEMKARGNLCNRGDFVGDCLSLSCFTTSVLRLCGFSADEVFNVVLIGHVVNIVKVNGKWYAFDSSNSINVRRGQIDSLVYEFYEPYYKGIMTIENDKYFVSFGTLWPDIYPYLTTPFSNMNTTMLVEIVEYIIPLFNFSYIGGPKDLGGYEWDILDFIENASVCPDMTTVSVPYTVADAPGSSPEEKAIELCNQTRTFIINQTGGTTLNQYDRCLYSYGYTCVEFPQAYANAAKFAAWAGWLAEKFDLKQPYFDCLSTVLRFRLLINNKQILPQDCVDFPDLNLLCRAGSSIDKALLAYGTLRNMKKDIELWQPKDMYVVFTLDNDGYLAVNISGQWKYLNFGGGKLILSEIPDSISIVFNEQEKLDTIP